MIDAKQFSDAVWSGNLETVTALIDNGADVNASDSPRNPPLNLAIEQQSVAIVRCLIDAGADINRSLEDGLTPLVHAIDIESDAAWQRYHETGHGSTGLIAVLLEAGAAPTDLAFKTAEDYGNWKVIELLDRFQNNAKAVSPSDRVARPSLRHRI